MKMILPSMRLLSRRKGVAVNWRILFVAKLFRMPCHVLAVMWCASSTMRSEQASARRRTTSESEDSSTFGRATMTFAFWMIASSSSVDLMPVVMIATRGFASSWEMI
ncbi:hypothetical protein XAUB_03260 [Xanthomonas citri pv. aurantifolii str. ICPB 11122]|nr:hypothetical protein XAUB_03260 [Xanthomonas citri pv. aurantifolii str. ICPB 11122]